MLQKVVLLDRQFLDKGRLEGAEGLVSEVKDLSLPADPRVLQESSTGMPPLTINPSGIIVIGSAWRKILKNTFTDMA